MQLLCGLVAVLLGATCFAASAAESSVAIVNVADEAPPQFQVFGAKDGLSDEIWSTLGFDAEGFVWAGSASALARFDGYRWTPYAFPEARSLVRDMVTDDSGVLWAIFEGEGLARYDGQRWALSGPPFFYHRFSILTGANGRQHIEAGTDRGLLRLDGDQWTAVGDDDPKELVIKSAQTRTLFGGEREWRAVSRDDLWYRERSGGQPSGPWQRLGLPGLQRMLFTDLLVTHHRGEEELWVLSYGNGLARLRSDGLRIWRAANGELPSEALYSAVATHTADGNRSLWIASRAGLLRIRDDLVQVLDRSHGLPSSAVRGIKLQRTPEGVDLLWLATEGGIARAALTPTQWQTVSLLGQRENGIFGLLIEPDGRGGERLWVGSAKEGLAMLEAGQWRYFNAASGTLPDAAVRNIWRLTGLDGTPWRILGMLGQPLLRIDDALQPQPLPTPWPLRIDEGATSAISRQHGGQWELWFGTLRSGAYRLTDAGWTPFGLDDGSSGWAVTGFATQIDAQGDDHLWVASNRGIARLTGSQFERVAEAVGLPLDGYRGVTLIDEGERSVLWASSNRTGVIRIDVTDPYRPVRLADSELPAAPDPTVYSVHRDSHGRIYVCTNNGVQQLTRRDGGGFDQRVYRRRDGLVHDECNSNSQAIDGQDRYWVGTLGGLSVFDPRIAINVDATLPRPLHFTGLRADARSLATRSDGPSVRIPAGTREVRVEFTLLSGMNEDRSIYRSRLEGFEAGPGEWTPEHSRSFTDLPPGAYRLQVEARDYAGTASPGGELSFEIEPLWWQHPATRIALVLLLLLGTFGLMLLYNRGLRARQRALARMVEARTDELHIANQRLTELSYLDPLTGLANRRRLLEVMDATLERARRQRLPIGVIVLDVDHFKAYNDRHGHLAGDAALRAVAHALESATREQDLVSRFGGEEFACLLLDAEIDTVARIAERMRALVEALPPRTLGNDTHTITLSAGILSRIPSAEDDAASLLHAADSALYEAKRSGRNRVCQANGGPSSSH